MHQYFPILYFRPVLDGIIILKACHLSKLLHLKFCTAFQLLLLALLYPPKALTPWPRFLVSIKSIVPLLALLLSSLPRAHEKQFTKIHSPSPPNPCLFISCHSCLAHSRLCKCSPFASLLLRGFPELGTCWRVLIVSVSQTRDSLQHHNLLTHLLSWTKRPFFLLKHPVLSWPFTLSP